MGWALAEVRFMGKEVFIEEDGGTLCFALGAHAEIMGLGPAEHASTEVAEVAAAKASNWISGVIVSDGGFIAIHCMFSWRNIDTGSGRRSDTRGETG
jgi:hypothetical protein